MDLFHGSLNHVTMFHLQYFFQLFEWQYPGELSVLITIIIINLHLHLLFFQGIPWGVTNFHLEIFVKVFTLGEYISNQIPQPKGQ